MTLETMFNAMGFRMVSAGADEGGLVDIPEDDSAGKRKTRWKQRKQHRPKRK